MKVDPPGPTTKIPELLTMPLTPLQYRVVAKVVGVSSRFERDDLVPEHALTIRWRIEVASAFLAALIDHAKKAADDEAEEDGEGDILAEIKKGKLVDLMLDLAIQRAREIDRQGHA